MRVTVFDYDAGNLHSLTKAIALSGATTAVEGDPRRCVDTDVLVLPGVGAFSHAATRLAGGREIMREAIVRGLPTIGVCLGMQLLFSGSDEGPGRGLGAIDGTVTRLNAARVPQIGWNTIDEGSDPLLVSSDVSTVYYANSFACRPRDTACVMAWTTYGDDRFPAMIRAYSTIGVQFHPEKSSTAGVRFLLAALEELRA
jgi:glutamine amidotransferase